MTAGFVSRPSLISVAFPFPQPWMTEDREPWHKTSGLGTLRSERFNAGGATDRDPNICYKQNSCELLVIFKRIAHQINLTQGLQISCICFFSWVRFIFASSLQSWLWPYIQASDAGESPFFSWTLQTCLWRVISGFPNGMWKIRVISNFLPSAYRCEHICMSGDHQFVETFVASSPQICICTS